MNTRGAVRNGVVTCNNENSTSPSRIKKQSAELERKQTVQAISDLFEGKLDNRPVRRRVPGVGEYVLVNECAGCFSRLHGGRYEISANKRYFGKVTQTYSHIIVMETQNGLTSERVSDIKVGLVQYVRLKSLPEHPEKLTYDEKLLSNFIRDFENLLME